jgi:iron transport multicopper oxidase
MFTVNGQPFVAPSVPVLLQILSGTPPASLMPTSNIYSLQRNKVVEISIPGGVLGGPVSHGISSHLPYQLSATSSKHPIHLHGHVFSVVRSAGNSTYNYVNPPQRDVVSIGTQTTDNTTIRFVTSNPGPWFMHCHIGKQVPSLLRRQRAEALYRLALERWLRSRDGRGRPRHPGDCIPPTYVCSPCEIMRTI